MDPHHPALLAVQHLHFPCCKIGPVSVRTSISGMKRKYIIGNKALMTVRITPLWEMTITCKVKVYHILQYLTRFAAYVSYHV